MLRLSRSRLEMAREAFPTDQEVLAALTQAHGVVGTAARLLGVARATLVRRLASIPDWELTRIDLEERVGEVAMSIVIEAVLSRKMSAAKWWLSRFALDRGFGSRRRLTRALKREEADHLRREWLQAAQESPDYHRLLQLLKQSEA